MKRKLVMTVKQILTKNDQQNSLQFLNKEHVGKKQIKMGEEIPKELKEAHFRFHRSESIELEVELQKDGSSKPTFVTMNGIRYKLEKE
jgi:hypothetical protein